MACVSRRLTIQGPAPLCELLQLEVQSSSKIDAIRLIIANHYEYDYPGDIDLRFNNETLLANKTLDNYMIEDNDIVIVAERITSRLEPVKKRKESLEVVCKPYYSPSVTRKDSSKQSVNVLPYDPQLSSQRSQSMPDLLLPSPHINRKKFAKASIRKTSAPVGLEAFTMRPSEAFRTPLPKILS